jgi:predicted nucleic acid-binding protein
MVVVDDPWGRKLSELYSLEYHGTIWILEKLHALEFLTASMVRQHLSQLKEQRIRFPLRAANELLRRLGEKELP